MIHDNEDIGVNAFDEHSKNEIILELSDDMLLESIYEQIDELKITENVETNDHLKIIDGRIQFLKMQSQDDDEFIDKLEDLQLDIYRKILERINSKLGQEFSFEDEYLVFNTKVIYNFFILRYDNLLIDFFKNYIEGNKLSLVNGLEEKINKNIVLKQYKKVLRKPEDAIILAYTFEVINLILDLDLSSDTFVDIATNGENIDRYPDCIVRDLFVSYDDEPVQTTVYGLKPGLYDVLIKRIKHNQEDYTNLVSRLQYDLSNTFPKKGTYNKK